ncbi:hypothetical protein EDD18DRAFT_704250 [Armillaria luteobubalina]|uniref:Uncharacterized protein n=1 Tax=Armillaria luteobubalina TaxID=153913 RepID=A0AA39PKJ3_9AGAR|nr:hypothetical protein EDD18DRAFT_704250 [Armillaria luteobubalina]
MLSHRCTLSLLYFATLASCITHSYFMVKEPREGAQWSNSAVNVLEWEKGVWDGVTHFDVEMTRMSEDGITYIAYNVPAQPSSPTSLNIYLEDVPTGDDYFVLLINSTHGVMHCLSPRFSIVNATASASSASSSVTPDSSIATVTVSGAPDPTKGFVTTFASRASSVVWGVGRGQAYGGATLVVGVVVGAMMVLW